MSVNGVVERGECTTCGDVPVGPNGKCSRCGGRLLMKPVEDMRPRAQSVVLPNTTAVRRWHHATKALRDDMAKRSKDLAKEAESKARDAQDSKRSLNLFDQVLGMIVVPEEPTRTKGSPLSLNGRWSRAYEACAECGQSDSPHAGHGMCSRCKQKAKKAAAK